MAKKVFNKPKLILIFNSNRLLIAVCRSLQAASSISLIHPQSISFCCNGKYRMAGGYYFRYANPNVVVGFEDLGCLKLEDYDNTCGVKREYRAPSKRIMDYWKNKRLENLMEKGDRTDNVP